MRTLKASSLQNIFRAEKIIDVIPDKKIGIYVALFDKKIHYVIAFIDEVEQAEPEDEIQIITEISKSLFSNEFQFEYSIALQRPEIAIYEDALLDIITLTIHDRNSKKIILL